MLKSVPLKKRLSVDGLIPILWAAVLAFIPSLLSLRLTIEAAPDGAESTPIKSLFMFI